MNHLWRFLDGIDILLVLGIVWVALHPVNNFVAGIVSLVAIELIVKTIIKIKKHGSLEENS